MHKSGKKLTFLLENFLCFSSKLPWEAYIGVSINIRVSLVKEANVVLESLYFSTNTPTLFFFIQSYEIKTTVPVCNESNFNKNSDYYSSNRTKLCFNHEVVFFTLPEFNMYELGLHDVGEKMTLQYFFLPAICIAI